MSAKKRGWIRSTRCEASGKRRYASEYDAGRDLRRIREVSAKEGKNHFPREAYDCEHCGGWHLTSSPHPTPRPAQAGRTSRPGSRQRRRQWRAALTLELLDRCPECQIHAPGCESRAVDIVPLAAPDLRNPAAWVTACTPCRDAAQNTTEGR